MIGKKFLILAAPILLIALSATGQFSQKPCAKCFIVMNEGDTIRCSVEMQEDYTHLKKIRIQVQNREEVQRVKVKDIQALRVPGKFYEKVRLEKGDHLLQRVANGYAKLYQDYSFELTESNEDDPEALVEIEPESPDPQKKPVYYLKIGDNTRLLDQKKFHVELAEYFNDFSELSQKLLAGRFEYSDVTSIVRNYNSWKAKQKTEPSKDK